MIVIDGHGIISSNNLEPSNDGIGVESRSLFEELVSFAHSAPGIVTSCKFLKRRFFSFMVEVRIKGMTSRYRPGAGKEVTIRKRLIKKKGKKCEVCSYSGYIEMHHIKRVVDGGEHSEKNCILLCEKCHAHAHGYKKKKYLDSEREHWIGEAL